MSAKATSIKVITTTTTQRFQPQQFKYRNLSGANETHRSISLEKFIEQKDQHQSKEKSSKEQQQNFHVSQQQTTTDEERQQPETCFQHAQVYANRVPSSVGGITLNLIGLASWINVLNNMSEINDQAIILPARLLLISVTLVLTGLNLFKIIVVPRSFLRDVLDLDTCGAWGAFFMSFTLLSSELQWLDTTPSKSLTLFVLLLASALQCTMLFWYLGYLLYLQVPPAPASFPATVGIGMTAIASRGLLPAWLQRVHPGLLLSFGCCLVLFPWVAYEMLRNDKVVLSPSAFVLAAPISLCMIAFYNTNVLSLDMIAATNAANHSSNGNSSNNSSSDNNSSNSSTLIMTSSHVLFVLCTVGMLVTVVCAWRRRAILTSKFWRTAAGSFVHHADAGVTFPIVAYATCCMLYCSQLGGEGMLLYWAWTWVVICVFVVGSTNVLFLCHLPSWIRHGLPPSFP